MVELLIALALIGFIVGLSVSSLSKLFRKELKASASKLSSTIRYLYNKSASEGVTLRLVLDMDESSYWVEAASKAVPIRKEEEKKEKEEKEKKREEKKEEKQDEEKKEEASSSILPQEVIFSSQESFLLKPVKLPKGVFLKDVFAEHTEGPISQGRAYIYFFAQGYVEPSVINLRDKDDEVHYSLKVNPISGVVKIENKYLELENDE